MKRPADQIALPLDWPQTDEDTRFIVSEANREAFEHFRRWSMWPVRATILTGPRRSGRTLLARTFVERVGGRLVDQAERADEEELFHAWNDAQDSYAVEVEGREVRFGAASMGNPHALIEVPDVATAPVAALGTALQRHAAFPDSVNVGFAERVSRNRIRLRVFERGAGETLACGSGACAAAAILMRRGAIDREVAVVLPGGELRVAWPSDAAPVILSGPARFVFEGEWLA